MLFKFKIISLFLCVLELSYAVTTYEDAETQTTEKWSIYNPSYRTKVKRIYDEEQKSWVIELLGESRRTYYLLRNANKSWWYDSENKIVQWSMKYSKNFRIFIRVKTTQGIRFLYYTPSTDSTLADNSGIYIHHGLGENSKNGQWQTFTRNLEKDLKEAQPNNELIYIAGIYVNGSGRFDDIKAFKKSVTNVIETNNRIEQNNTITTSSSQTNSSSILYITSTDKDGEYKCDGISDQIEINKALDRVASNTDLTTVYLKGKMDCIIDEPILISANTSLLGDANVTVKLKDNIAWYQANKPLIGQKNSNGSIAWKKNNGSISNIEIGGFELSGGVQTEPTGQYFIILINLYDATNVKIHDMNLHDSRGDIIRFYGSNIGKSNNLEVYNNHIENSGHEGIYFIYPNKIKAYNNKIYHTRTNTGIRISSGSNFEVYSNKIGNSLTNSPSGYAGILVDSSSAIPIGNAQIYNNYIYGKNGGIVLEGSSGFNSKNSLNGVHIHHNILYKINNYANSSFLNGAIRINGFHNTLIEHNTIEDSQKDAIVYDEYKGVTNRGVGYKTIVRNNIISNSKGYGINNLNSNMHTFITENNNLFNNRVDNYNNVASSSDIHVEPLYANVKFSKGWHHLVATYDSVNETFKIYVDGKEKATQKFSGFGTIGHNNHYISLGTYRGLDIYQLQGKLDNMAVWERALNANEVLTLWNNGQGGNINGLTQNLQAYWQMNNNWNDSFGAYHSQSGWSSATFSSLAKLGTHAGVFNGGRNYTLFPNTLSPSSSITIATWIYRETDSLNNQMIQTIFNKGAQERNNHIWLYAQGENFYFELGNGRGLRHSLSTSGINPDIDLDLHLKSEYGRWYQNNWVFDTQSSLAIDQAKPSSDYSKELPSNGGQANLGAYGNTKEASRSQ